jgi:membrane associated rhomboid family serine protease
MLPSPMQFVVAIALVAVAFGIWLFEGRGRWRARLEDRFVYGVPWGTALVVAINVGFYLFAQSGLTHWDDPVIYAYISWSYFYPLGMVTSGISHGSPAHLIGNMTGTLALGVIAEYAWSHYPRAAYGSEDADDEIAEDRTFVERPLVRALVFFPGALLAVGLLTAVYSLQPSLGFSGAVYALIGFAVVYYPLRAVAGVVAASAIGVIWNALTSPSVTSTVSSSPPSPPSWAGIGFQAHALGFLFGVFAALALLTKRDRFRSTQRVFFGVVGVGLAMSLWLVAWPGGTDEYTLYRGVGVVLLLVVTSLVAVAAGGSRSDSLVTKRKAAIGALVAFTFLVAAPGVLGGIFVVDDGGIEGSQAVEIEDYTVAYAEDASIGRELPFGDANASEQADGTEVSGVLLTSEDREIWTRAVRADVLEFTGNETVVVGGIGWRETVRAQRIGWDVAGNGTAYVVDLHHDGETTRSFTSEPTTASARIEGYDVTVVPTQEAFELRVRDDGGVVDTVPIPEATSETSVGDVRIVTELEDGVRHVSMETDDSRAVIAEEETYD